MLSRRRLSEITTDKTDHWIIILMAQQTAAHIKKIMDLTTLALPATNTTLAGSNCDHDTPGDGCECQRGSADPFQSKTLEACINV